MNYIFALFYLLASLLPATGFAHGAGSYTKKYQPNEITKSASVAIADRYQLSIHIQGNDVQILVNDSKGKPVKLGTSSATIFVSSGKKDSWFKLYADDHNKLTGTGKLDPDKELKLEVSIHIAGEKPFNASFRPFVSKNPTSIRY